MLTPLSLRNLTCPPLDYTDHLFYTPARHSSTSNPPRLVCFQLSHERGASWRHVGPIPTLMPENAVNGNSYCLLPKLMQFSFWYKISPLREEKCMAKSALVSHMRSRACCRVVKTRTRRNVLIPVLLNEQVVTTRNRLLRCRAAMLG